MSEAQFTATYSKSGVAPMAVQVAVVAQGFVFRSGEHEQRASFSDVRLSLGGFENDFYFITLADGATISAARAQCESILRSAATSHPSLANEFAACEKAARKARASSRVGMTVVAITVLLILGAVLSIPAAARHAVVIIPRSVDVMIGDHAADSTVAELGIENHDPALVGFVSAVTRKLLERLPRHQDYSIRESVIRSDNVNAMALPGGHLYVLTGLLSKAKSADEVAGVMGHEIAHVVLRHHMRRLGTQAIVMLAASWFFGDLSSGAAAASQVVTLGASRHFDQGDELEADQMGADLAIRAGFDARALSSFFRRMSAEEGDTPVGLQWLSSHPDFETRCRAIDALPPSHRDMAGLHSIDALYTQAQQALQSAH